uniref:Secreted protein n=1 Tax=Trieres chinensis TaxID=1514140 RepID=A0A7S2A050_TRICV
MVFPAYTRLPLLLSATAAVVGALSFGAPQTTRRATLAAIPAIAGAALSAAPPLPSDAATTDGGNAAAAADAKPKFRRYPQIRFIAALGDPTASSGVGCEGWGLWRDDPGPRGVYLRDYDDRIAKRGGVAPAGWTFNGDDWWVEEHGLIMSTPDDLPRRSLDRSTGDVVPYKRYVVTGDREVTTILTVHDDGRWELAKGSLYDVTHLPCRSARYTPAAFDVGANGDAVASTCVPGGADKRSFPVKPGAEMPPISGCAKQDYAVLFVLGEEA